MNLSFSGGKFLVPGVMPGLEDAPLLSDPNCFPHSPKVCDTLRVSFPSQMTSQRDGPMGDGSADSKARMKPCALVRGKLRFEFGPCTAHKVVWLLGFMNLDFFIWKSRGNNAYCTGLL